MNVQSQLFQSVVFVLVFIIGWQMENWKKPICNTSKTKHFLNNLIFSLGGGMVQIILGVFFLKILAYENANEIGLLRTLNVQSIFFQLAFTFIFLDFFYWTYHVLMHKIPVLWAFHAVHHSDPILDVSTALREHPVETVIRLLQYILFVLILGPSLWVVSLHQFIQIISKIIIHTDYAVPKKLDKVLSLLLVTPRLHHIHHHFENPYTDSNYGDLFSIWDRLFGTFKHLERDQITFGLDVLPENKDRPTPWKSLLKQPFDKLKNLNNYE